MRWSARRSTWARARVALVCRSLDAARARFGAPADALGAVWTRTGRPFFDAGLTTQLVDRLRVAAESAGLFEELGASWLLFDMELLPWSAKAGPLVRDQYAAVGAAARAALPAAIGALDEAARSGLDVGELLDRTRTARGQRGGIHCRVSPLLLADRRSRRGAYRAVPIARQ